MKRLFLASGLTLFAVVAMAPGAVAAENEADVPTFNGEVATILFENCTSCHRTGQVAPMTLSSYSDARPWARAIKSKVVSREMPPWFADPRYGQFKEVSTLTQSEIDTIAAWADGGAPEGDGLTPEPPVFTSEWRHDRPPDYIIETIDIEVPAQGELDYVKLWLDNPFEEDIYLEAVQMRPGNTEVVHHTGVHTRALPPGTRMGEKQYSTGQMIRQPVPLNEVETEEVKRVRAQTVANGNDGKDALLIFYTPGRGFARYPEGTGKRVYADRYIMFNTHLTPAGRPQIERSQAGFWVAKETPKHQVLTISGGTGPVRIVENAEQVGLTGSVQADRQLLPYIPAHAEDFKVTGIWPVTDDMTIYGVWPHMHFRGKDMTYLISYPDGTEETMLNVPNYDFNWQLEYDFIEPLKVPAGSTIKTIAHYDNSIKNRYNPSPDRDVHWGEQSWDEMFMIFTKYSVDKDILVADAKPPTHD